MVDVLSDILASRPENATETIVPASYRVLTGNTVPPKKANIYTAARVAASPAGSPASHTSALVATSLHDTCWASNFIQSAQPLKTTRGPTKDENDLYSATYDHNDSNYGNENGTGNYHEEDEYDDDDDQEEDEQKETISVRIMREEVTVSEELPGTLADVVA